MTKEKSQAMRLYYFHGATCGLKARLTAVEKKFPVDEIVLQRDQLKSAQYLALNPKGVVPTLVDGDKVILESTTIMRYLDEQSAEHPLQPGDPYSRTVMNNWLKTMDEVFFPAIGFLTLGLSLSATLNHLTDEELRKRMKAAAANGAIAEMRFDAVRNGLQSVAVTDGIAAIDDRIGTMNAELAIKPWLAGADISLADLAIAPIFVRLDEFGFLPLWTDRWPRVSKWWNRLVVRRCYLDVVVAHPNPEASRHRAAGEENGAAIQRLLAGRPN